MIESRNINIIVDADGNRLVLINDVVFKGKRNVNWDEVKTYLEQYVGDYYEIEETSEINFRTNIQVQRVKKYCWELMQKRKQMLQQLSRS